MDYFLKFQFKKIIIFFIPFILVACSQDFYGPPITGQAFVVSVSSDGNYAISSNENKKAILWDIRHKTHKTISSDANVYSVYFIKKTDDFIWQDDKTNNVFVENVDGKILRTLHLNFPTYGEVMTGDLKHYVASNEAWALYEGDPDHIKRIKYGNDNNGFEGSGKLLNLSLSDNNKYLLTSGYSGNQGDDLPLSQGLTAKDVNPEIPDAANFSIIDGTTVWDVATEKPIDKFSGNEAKTFAAISPDGDFTVSGDEESVSFVWSTITGKKEFNVDDICCGKLIKVAKTGNIDKDYKWDPSGLIKPPQDVITTGSGGYFSIKFIDLNEHYLAFYTRASKHIALFSVLDPKPIKYLRLATYPKPTINDYSMDEAIDTAPAAHILVMGQNNGPGIIVYKYHPDTQTLEKIWAPGADARYLINLIFINFILTLIVCYGLLVWEKSFQNFLVVAVTLQLIYIPFGFLYFYDWGIASGCSGTALGMIIAILLLRKMLNTSISKPSATN